MTWSLVVLCTAAIFLVAAFVSTIVSESLTLLSRFSRLLSPRNRARLWLGVASLPLVLSLTIVGLTLLPATSSGTDHCLDHAAEHPHLCLDHSFGTPGMALIVLALVAGARMIYSVGSFARLIHLDATTARALREGCNKKDGTLVFPAEQPQGFTLGILRPQVHVSQGLLDLDAKVAEVVIEHERAHALHRDPLYRALFPLLSLLHLPSTAKMIRAEFVGAQEIAADRVAARTLADPVVVAEAILALTRVQPQDDWALSFSDGDIQERVRALLSPGVAESRGPIVALLSFTMGTALLLASLHESLHHALESLLGILS